MEDKVQKELVELFTQKAQAVSAIVKPIGSLKEAYAYATDICLNKEACQLLMSGCEGAVSDAAADLCATKAADRIIAAPQFEGKRLKELKAACDKAGIKLLTEGMRDNLAGIDVGFTIADCGLAETGTLVVDSSSEEVRLSTMISEINVVVLPLSKLRKGSYDAEDELSAIIKNTPSYMAFITGASRTADIERVLTIGVHGPERLIVVCVDDLGGTN